MPDEVDIRGLLEAWWRDPRDRTLADLVLPALGLEPLGSPREPGRFWTGAGRLDRDERGWFDPVTGMPLAARHSRSGVEMVWVPSGAVELRSFDLEEGFSRTQHMLEYPTHHARAAEVREVEGFWLGRFPVTVEQFLRLAPGKGAGPEVGEEQLRRPGRPVVFVDQDVARGWCRRAGGRLPFDAEWQLAAGGPQPTAFPWGGEEPDPSRAHFHAEGRTTMGFLADEEAWDRRLEEVGGRFPGRSPCGAEEMAGSVWEWTGTWFQGRWPRTWAGAGTRRASGCWSGGGSWRSSAWWLRVDAFRAEVPGARVGDLGFRLAVPVAPSGSGGGVVRRTPFRRLRVRTVDRSPRPTRRLGEEKDVLGDPLPRGAVRRFGSARWRHGGSVSDLAILGGGSRLLTASRDGTVRSWDPESGRCLQELDVFRGLPVRAAVDRAEALLATAGGDGVLRIWELPAFRQVLRVDRFPAPPVGVALSPLGERVAVACRDGACLVLAGIGAEEEPGELLTWLEVGASEEMEPGFARGGEVLLLGAPGRLHRFRVPGGERLEGWPEPRLAPHHRAGSRCRVVATAFSRNGRVAAIGEAYRVGGRLEDGAVRLVRPVGRDLPPGRRSPAR